MVEVIVGDDIIIMRLLSPLRDASMDRCSDMLFHSGRCETNCVALNTATTLPKRILRSHRTYEMLKIHQL